MSSLTTTEIGRRAETAAASYLKQHGYRILDQNWRTRWCEIDLVAVKGSAVSFVEVKYRRSDAWGDGLDYITTLKRKQMAFAAEFWMAAHDWMGPCYLAAVAVTGPHFKITEFIPEI